MGKRRSAREAALEALYCYEIRGDSSIEEIFPFCSERHELSKSSIDFALSLLKNTIDNLEIIDKEIACHIKNWEIKRLALIDKNVLRLGLAELLYFPDIPKKVTIDEAIELAKSYGSSESGRFVNGVLDALSKDN